MKTTTTPKRNVWLTSLILALGTGRLQAQEPSQQQAALKLIRETAADICTTVPIQGHDQSVDLTGAAQAKLAGVLGRVADLGIDGAAKYQSGEYKGVLRQELATAIKNGNDCKLSVFNALVPKLLVPAPAQSPLGSPQPKAANPTRTQADTSHLDDPRARFGPGAVRFKGKEIIVSNCGVGGCSVTVRFSVENTSGVDIEAALRRGSISVGSCTNIETTSSGFPYAFGAGSERMTWSNMAKPAQPRFVGAGGRIEATIATPYSNCTDTLRGIQTTDLALSIAVTWSSKTFDIPLYAEAVPVRWVDRQ